MRSDWNVSVRRACSTLRVDRALYVYKSKRGDQAALKHRIKDICETRVRYGYRWVHMLLQPEGWAINVKRVYRLYRELSLQLRNKTPKRRVKAKLREDRTEARQINETWAMDFVHDQLATGRKIRVLTIVDIFSRFSPAVDPRFSYRGQDVVLTLERICNTVGYPRTIRVGVRLPRSRHLGLPKGPRAGLLAGRQADRQQLHRIIQWQVQKRMLEHALVPEP